MKKSVFNLPNILTIIRLFLIPIMVILFYVNNVYAAWILFVLYWITADGLIELGKFLVNEEI